MKNAKMDLELGSRVVRTPRIGSSGARATFEKTESIREGFEESDEENLMASSPFCHEK